MIELIGVGLGGLGLGWFLRQWTLFKGSPVNPPSKRYEVKLVRQAKYGTLSKSLITSDDLQEAKQVFKSTTVPHNCTVEFYTDGNHTASRS